MRASAGPISFPGQILMGSFKSTPKYFILNPNPCQKCSLANHNAVLRCRGYRISHLDLTRSRTSEVGMSVYFGGYPAPTQASGGVHGHLRSLFRCAGYPKLHSLFQELKYSRFCE
jgi:hypothetical protein